MSSPTDVALAGPWLRYDNDRYMLLSTVQMVYAYYVEKESIFVGRRKALVDGRVSSACISSTRTSNPYLRSPTPPLCFILLPDRDVSHVHIGQDEPAETGEGAHRTSAPQHLSTSPASAFSGLTDPHFLPDFFSPPRTAEQYTLTLSSSRSTNAGKSLLARLSTASSRAVGEFVDVEGVVDVKGFEAWVVGLIEQGGSEGKTD